MLQLTFDTQSELARSVAAQSGPIRAVSLTQPWATLVAIGAKTIETRSWPTDYRGPLAIHASKKFGFDEQRLCFREPFLSVLKAGGYDSPWRLPLGAVIAIGRLVGCRQVTRQTVLPPEDSFEWDFGDLSYGRYLWDVADVQMLERPVPARGALGLWAWSG